MPTIGAHVSDDDNTAVEIAAKAANVKVGTWATEAIRQRLSREGMLPGNPRAEINAAIEEVGVDRALEVLKKAVRRKQPEPTAAR